MEVPHSHLLKSELRTIPDMEEVGGRIEYFLPEGTEASKEVLVAFMQVVEASMEAVGALTEVVET